MSGPTIAQVDAAVRAVLEGRPEPRSTAIRPIFAGRLLGLKQAEGVEAVDREVFVAPGTVVTPLAKDFLKKRGIAVRIVAGTESGNAGEWGFVVEHASGTAAAVKRGLLEGPDSWVEIGGTTLQAASWIASGQNRGAAVLTGEAAVSCWRANGASGIRAAVAGEADAVARAIRTLGVNLLVIEIEGKSIPWIRHLLATFHRGGAPAIPEGLERGPLARVERDEDRRGDRPGDALSRPFGPAERALRDRLAHAALGPGGRLVGPR